MGHNLDIESRHTHTHKCDKFCSPPFITDTYLLTPWSTVLLQKLTGSAASQEIPAFYGTRKFITVLTSARLLSLS